MMTMTGGQSPGSSATPGHSPRPPSAALLRTLPGWNYSEVVVGSNLHFIPLFFFFFFFFFLGQGGGSAAKTKKGQRGEVVSRPQQPTVLWSDAPSAGTACSLELSLPSPTGIWFKTPLPVGGANTAELPPEGALVSRQPRGKLLSTSEAGSVGVAVSQSD